MAKESAWHRARKDTDKFRSSAKFFWVVEVLGAAVAGVIGGVVGALLTPESPTKFQQYFYPAAGAAAGVVAGFVIVFSLIFIWHLLRAPYKQRDDAIQLANEVQQKYESILATVRHKLAFDSPALITRVFSDCITLQVGAKFRNACPDEMIEFKIMRFKATVADKTVEHPDFVTTSGFIHPLQTREYYFPVIRLEGKPDRFIGTLEYEVLYSSVPNTQWYKSGRKMGLEFKWQGRNLTALYKMEQELEE
jgi:hypothetical protein